jgi:hypothetical protein
VRVVVCRCSSIRWIVQIENVFDHRSLAKRTLRELKLVRTFNHENILGLERVMRPHSSSFNNIYLVSELMETDLACVIRSPQELTDEHCQLSVERRKRSHAERRFVADAGGFDAFCFSAQFYLPSTPRIEVRALGQCQRLYRSYTVLREHESTVEADAHSRCCCRRRVILCLSVR